MKIEKTNYGKAGKGGRGIEACKLTHGDVEMIVLTGAGPRIISLRLAGGPNILFEDKSGKMGRGAWRIYGGHRIWLAPESEVCYDVDNDPCKVTVKGECLHVETSISPNRLRKILEIVPCAKTGGFEVRQSIRNEGPGLAYGAMWVLTCVDTQGTILVPWRSGSADWTTSMVRYWNYWNETRTNVESKQWKARNGYFAAEPNPGEFGKVGLHSSVGVIALLRKDLTFVKSTDPIEGAEYPDGGCNIEIYTCPNFFEMETLGPIGIFHPGQTLTQIETWVLSPKTFKPAQYEKVAALMGK